MATQWVSRRVSKYGNRAVVADGQRFDSRREHKRYQDLAILERAGAIQGLRRQVSFQLYGMNGQPLKIKSKGYPNGRVARYVADFCYDERGVNVIEDSKGGVLTAEYKLKRAIMESMGYSIRET